MSITFRCDQCGRTFHTDESNAGKKGKCKQCGHPLVIPGLSMSSGDQKPPSAFKTFGEVPAKPARPARPARPEPDVSDDPYGLDELAPLPLRQGAGPRVAEDEEFRGPKRFPMKSSRAHGSGGDESAGIFVGPPLPLFVVPLAIAGVSYGIAQSGPSPALGWMMLASTLLGFVIALYGGLGLILLPFQESAFHGVLSFFFWPYQLFYVVTRWNRMQGAFLSQVAGIATFIIGAYLPFNALRHSPAQTVANLRLPPGVQRPTEGTLITVEVMSGPTDHDTQQFVFEKLNELNQGGNIQGAGSTKLAFLLWPIKDPEEFAGRIDFAKVAKVDGRTIYLQPVTITGPRRPPDSDKLGQALFDLGGKDQFRRGFALLALTQMEPNDERRDEVVKVLEAEIATANGSDRSHAIEALGKWGGKASCPTMAKLLGDRDPNAAREALRAIARFEDPVTIEPLTRCLAKPEIRDQAVETLKTFGVQAEPKVIPFLSHGDADTRQAAASVLQIVGTKASLQPLQDLIQRNNNSGGDSLVARMAINDIKSRIGQVDEPAPVPAGRSAGKSRGNDRSRKSGGRGPS